MHASNTRSWFERRPIRDEYLIVDGGQLADIRAHSYKVGKTTRDFEKAL